MHICDVAPSEIDDLLDLAVRAFGEVTEERTERRRRAARARIADGRCLGVRDDGRLIAAAAIIDMTQYWHGRAVPLAGVTSVVVAPEDRGRGAGPLLMTAGTPATTLRLTGLLTGGDSATDGALDAAFACRAYTLDTF